MELNLNLSENLDTENVLEDKLRITNSLETVEFIIKNVSNIVIGVTAPYGGGKTFFAKSLEKRLKNADEVNPIYINLWENDYKDPLITLISYLLPKNLTQKDKKLIDIATNVFTAISAITSATSIAGINLDTNKISKNIQNLFENKEKTDIQSLKEEIEKIAKNKKIIYLVDEIDRCRPEFAIEFLERIKHFFNIKNVIFVLFINQDYVEVLQQNYTKTFNSINNYGNYTGFINKFINTFIVLQHPRWDEFIEHHLQCTHYPINSRKENLYVSEVEKKYYSLIIGYFNLSPRDIITICNNISTYNKIHSNFKHFNGDKEFKNYPTRVTLFLMYSIKLKHIGELLNIMKNGDSKLFRNMQDYLSQEAVYKGVYKETSEGLKLLLNYLIIVLCRRLQINQGSLHDYTGQFSPLIKEYNLLYNHTPEKFEQKSIDIWFHLLLH